MKKINWLTVMATIMVSLLIVVTIVTIIFVGITVNKIYSFKNQAISICADNNYEYMTHNIKVGTDCFLIECLDKQNNEIIKLWECEQ